MFWMCGSAGVFLAVWVCGCVFGCVGVRVCFGCVGVRVCFGCMGVRVCFGWVRGRTDGISVRPGIGKRGHVYQYADGRNLIRPHIHRGYYANIMTYY